MDLKAVGLGAGGHARVVIEILRSCGGCDLAGLLDAAPELRGRSVLGVSVLGDDDLLPGLVADGVTHFFVGSGGVGDNAPRRRLFERGLGHRMEPLNVAHPSAAVSPSAQLGKGIVIMANAVVNCEARLGANVIVNTSAVVEHDCMVGDHVHLATGARLCGGVVVDEGAHVGAGATVIQGVKVGANAVVGAGAVVVRDVPAGMTVVGSPARAVRHTEGKGEGG